ncbi:MAG: hypothetical protein Q8J88_00850 [Bacteroidales bacterium]|nr:hypothetical protein [Bacteroidales bacterium]
MKKLIFFLFAWAVLALPVAVFAGENPDPSNGNPISLGMFVDLTALAAGIAAITLFIKNTFNTSGLITDIVSWTIGPVLGLIGFYFKLGMFAEVVWYGALLYGLLASFYANKGYDILSVIRGKKDVEYVKIE